METVPTGNVGGTNLPSEICTVLAGWETDPTPVATCSSKVSGVEPTSAMVTRSHAREGRGKMFLCKK